MYQTKKFSETDLTVLSFITVFFTFIIGKDIINISEKYMVELFILLLIFNE